MSTALIYRIQGNNSDRYWMVRATKKKPDIHIILLWVSILCSMYVIYKILYIIYRYTHVGPKYLVRNNNVALYRRHHKDARYCIFDMQTCHCSVCVCLLSKKHKQSQIGKWWRMMAYDDETEAVRRYIMCAVFVLTKFVCLGFLKRVHTPKYTFSASVVVVVRSFHSFHCVLHSEY